MTLGKRTMPNRRDVTDEIEAELFIEGRVDRGGRADQEERIAVRWRAHDRLSADIAACTCPVLNNECLPMRLVPISRR